MRTKKYLFNAQHDDDTFMGIAATRRNGVTKEVIRDWGEFLALAKMDYAINKLPALVHERTEVSEVPNQFHLVRSSDNVVVSPSTVTKQYGVLTPSDIVQELEPFVSQGWATPDAGFILNDHSEVIVMRLDGGQLPDNGSIGGENYTHYAVVQNFHGRGSARGRIISRRLVCDNMMRSIFSEGADFSITHRQNVKERFEWAIASWTKLQEAIKKLAEHLKLYMDFELDAAEVDATINKILAIKDGEDVSARKQNQKEAILIAARMSPGCQGQTAFDLYNGVTWYNSHHETARGSVLPIKRVASFLNGSRGQLEDRAVNVLNEMVGVE